VYHAEHITSHKEAVVKICYFSRSSKRDKFRIEVENTLLLQDSRYVARVLHHHEEEKYGVMYLRKYETDLLEYLMDHPFTLSSARGVFFRVCKGVLHAHSRGIAHRDLKPENIFMDRKGKPVIGDFGSSIKVDEGELCDECIGTELYCAPEVLRGEHYNPFASDVFSLGILLHVLVCGHWPYTGSSKTSVRENIKNGHMKLMEPAFSKKSFDLLSRMTAFSPSDRPRMEDVIHHPWFVKDPLHCPLVTPQHSIDDDDDLPPITIDGLSTDDDFVESDMEEDVAGYRRYGSAADPEVGPDPCSLSADTLPDVSLGVAKRHRSFSTSLRSSLTRLARVGRKPKRMPRQRGSRTSSGSTSPSHSRSPDRRPITSPGERTSANSSPSHSPASRRTRKRSDSRRRVQEVASAAAGPEPDRPPEDSNIPAASTGSI